MLTLAIIKPDAMADRAAGKILAHLEAGGFTIRAARTRRFSRADAEAFYAVHRDQPFFRPLVAFMTSGLCLGLALEADNAVERLREVIGATDPALAAPGTVRALYGASKERNAIHASDAPATAEREVAFFFAGCDLV